MDRSVGSRVKVWPYFLLDIHVHSTVCAVGEWGEMAASLISMKQELLNNGEGL